MPRSQRPKSGPDAESGVPPWRPSRSLALGALVFLAAAVIFRGALKAPIVDGESFNIVFSQHSLRSWKNLPDLANSRYFMTFGEGGYRPLTTLGYFLAFQVSGADPFGFMLLKFFVHFMGSAFLFGICGMLFKDRFWAAVAAAVYFLRMVDPAFVGMVLLPDMLAACFSLGALWSYLRMAGGRSYSARWCALTCLLALGAVLAKEMSVLLPGVLLSHRVLFPQYYPGRAVKRFLKEHVPVWAAMGLYLAGLKWWIAAESFYGPVEWAWPTSFSWSIVRFFEYFRSFFSGPMFLPSEGLVLLVILLVLSFWKRSHIKETGRFFAFAAAWAALALIPVLNIFPFPRFQAYFGRMMEPRYLAFAGAAMAFLLGSLGQLCGRKRPLGILLGGLAVLGIARGTYAAASRGANWRGDLDRRVVARSSFPEDAHLRPWHEFFPARALFSYPLIRKADPDYALKIGRHLLESFTEGQAEGILAYFGDDSLYTDDWKTKHVQGMFGDKSAPEFLRGVEAESLFTRGLKRLDEGSADLAAADFAATIERDSLHTSACFGLVKAHRSSRRDLGLLRLPDACWGLLLGDGDTRQFVMREDWPSLERDKVRAETLLREGRYEEARKAYEEVINRAYWLWPETGPVLMELTLLKGGAREHFDGAINTFASGDSEGAIKGFGRAIRAKPDYAEALLSRGVLLSRAGAWERSLEDFDKALNASRHRGLRAMVLEARAGALDKLGRVKEARADRLRAGREKNPDFGL